MPPLRWVAGALHRTTEYLAAQLSAPTKEPPNWTEAEWRVAQAVAAIHGVSSLLADTLRWTGPQRWRRFLEDQKSHTSGRYDRIRQLLAQIDAAARREGIALVALKGSALHAIGIYDAGQRPMSDIDLLVQGDHAAASELLVKLRYQLSYVTPKHWVYSPMESGACGEFGEHVDNPIKIELHTAVREWLPIAYADISEQVFPSQPLPGLNAYPSTAALMLHLLLHAAGNMCHRGLRLIHLHDVALLSSRMSSSDWDCVLARIGNRNLRWLFPPLAMAARYYQSAIPSYVLTAAASDCPLLLRSISRRRTLSDWSLSSLWVDAFPAIVWSTSYLEMLRYVVIRVRPSHETLALRTIGRVAGPARFHDRWTTLSQTQRMLRWIVSRPPRIETISSVAAAFNQAAPTSSSYSL